MQLFRLNDAIASLRCDCDTWIWWSDICFWIYFRLVNVSYGHKTTCIIYQWTTDTRVKLSWLQSFFSSFLSKENEGTIYYWYKNYSDNHAILLHNRRVDFFVLKSGRQQDLLSVALEQIERTCVMESHSNAVAQVLRLCELRYHLELKIIYTWLFMKFSVTVFP